MLSYEDYVFVSSEISELEYLLENTPKENVIDRMSLESRLEGAKNKISVEHTRKKMWLYHYTDLGDKMPNAVADGFAGFVKEGQIFEFKEKDK